MGTVSDICYGFCFCNELSKHWIESIFNVFASTEYVLYSVPINCDRFSVLSRPLEIIVMVFWVYGFLALQTFGLALQ